jgi:hypothetical protein
MDRQTDSKEPHCLYPAQDMHGRQQFPGHFLGMQGTLQLASQVRNKAKVKNIFVTSPHITSSDVTALCTILCSCQVGGGKGNRWATYRTCKTYKYLLYCDSHFAFNHRSVQVLVHYQ